MKAKIVCVCIGVIVYIASYAQGKPINSVRFVDSLSWKSILENAKENNKCIFADFYATWCGPCKEMEKTVYVSEKVGKFANDHFISVKIQVDKNNSDNDVIRSWYSDADSLSKEYHIGVLPTLVFISPDGNIIDKEEGYKSEAELLDLLESATSKNNKYALAIDLYNKHQLPYSEMEKLALATKKNGDYRNADAIARDYKINFLDKLNDKELLTKHNVSFITNFPSLINPGDRFFSFFYTQGLEAELLIQARSGYSRDLVKFIICEEQINHSVYKNDKPSAIRPDWKRLYRNIEVKYRKDYADEIIFSTQLKYYSLTQNWKELALIFNRQIAKYPPRIGNKNLGGVFDDVWELNEQAWNLFLHCNEKKVLNKALKWSNLSIELCNNENELIQCLDTKANLLYKMGVVKEAIVLEQRVLNLSKDNQGYKLSLANMTNGTPTWPSN